MIAELLAHLKSIRDNGPVDLDEGICYNARRVFPYIPGCPLRNDVSVWISSTMEHWPEYSGYLYYPIRAYICNSPEEEYGRALDDGDTWDKGTEYGAARYRLLDFLIERAEAEVAALTTQS